MARRKISQREARSLQKELGVAQAENKSLRSRYAGDYPGTFIWRIPGTHETTKAVFENTRRLGHAIVVKLEADTLNFYAVKP